MKCTSTLRGILVRVKQTKPDRKKGVVYEVPCKDCSRVYIGEMGRTLEKWLSKHKNGIALHAWANQHQLVNWEAAMHSQGRGKKFLETKGAWVFIHILYS